MAARSSCIYSVYGLLSVIFENKRIFSFVDFNFDVYLLAAMGNEKANSYWEAELPPNYDRVGIENFIRAKYDSLPLLQYLLI
jgi:hypothetical protein